MSRLMKMAGFDSAHPDVFASWLLFFSNLLERILENKVHLVHLVMR